MIQCDVNVFLSWMTSCRKQLILKPRPCWPRTPSRSSRTPKRRASRPVSTASSVAGSQLQRCLCSRRRREGEQGGWERKWRGDGEGMGGTNTRKHLFTSVSSSREATGNSSESGTSVDEQHHLEGMATEAALAEGVEAEAGPKEVAGDVAGAAAGEAAAGSHVFLWITRTSRQATCSACNEPIAAWDFRMAHHPDPRTVEDRRQWRKVWWRYYHLRERCVLGSPARPDMLASAVMDAAPMGERRESSELYKTRCAEALATLTAILNSAA